MPGYPIRTPWDPRSVDNSPRPIAASHVLHRLLVPRHPPFALTNLTTKMLASTVQFSNNTPPTTHTHHIPLNPASARSRSSLVEDGTGQKQQPLHKEAPPPAGKTHYQGPGCSFRTQQDVSITTPPAHPSRVPTHPQVSCTNATNQTRRCDLPVSPPLSPRGRHLLPNRVLPPAAVLTGGECSLERR
jgi:hypothetical protein